MSARDLATVGRLVASFPEVKEWGGIQQAPFGDGTRTMYNPNHLLRTYRGATGLKTGYIVASGFSVTATAERDGLRLLAVILGSPSKQDCFREAAKLLDWGFSNYQVIDPVKEGELVGPTIAVSEGSKAFFRGRAAKGLHLVLPRAEARGVGAEVRVPAQVSAPIHEGQKVGEVVVKRGDQELGRVEVIAPLAIEHVAWWSSWWKWLRAKLPA
jgi:D-alanyl-D-alanine carboxypeptidase (penicillin-binding protein 5/6)